MAVDEIGLQQRPAQRQRAAEVDPLPAHPQALGGIWVDGKDEVERDADGEGEQGAQLLVEHGLAFEAGDVQEEGSGRADQGGEDEDHQHEGFFGQAAAAAAASGRQ